MNQPQKISDVMFGVGVMDEAVGGIMDKALKANTQEAYAEAVTKLEGIDFLWICFRCRRRTDDSTGIFESLALQNSIITMMRFRDDEDARREFGEDTKHLRRNAG